MNLDPTHFINFRNHLECFVELNDNEFQMILHYFKLRKLKKHEYLIHAGDYVRQTYWVNRGLLISNIIDSGGKERIVQFAIENCWITDQNAFYNQGIASFNTFCMENSEVLFITYDDRERLCDSLQKMEKFFRKKGNDSFVTLQKRLLTYLTADAEQRLTLLLEEYPTLFQRLTKKILAAYLGVSRETLSRLKG